MGDLSQSPDIVQSFIKPDECGWRPSSGSRCHVSRQLGTHRQWHVDTTPNNRMNLTGIPLPPYQQVIPSVRLPMALVNWLICGGLSLSGALMLLGLTPGREGLLGAHFFEYWFGLACICRPRRHCIVPFNGGLLGSVSV